MKKQNLSFLKLLCFKNNFNRISLDIVCIIFAIGISCILLQYAVVAPSDDIIDFCEVALFEYLENPVAYSPSNNVSIILNKNTIIAVIPRAFTYSVATQNENQAYQVTTHVKFGLFILVYLLEFIFVVILGYITCELLLFILMKLGKFFFKGLNEFKIFIFKKIIKIKNKFEHKQKQKGLKEYEIPRLQEIYQLGYNMGRADGIAEGMKLGKYDFYYRN